jgi:hypothetical protein
MEFLSPIEVTHLNGKGLRVGLAGWLGLVLVACGGGSAAVDAGQPECTQGTEYSCIGQGGCPGTQHCSSSGVLSACACDPSAAPGALDAAVMSSDAGPKTAADAGGGTAGRRAPRDAGMPPAPSDAATSNTTPSEDCGNGVDDDGDGKIDCADEDCAARTCLATAPAGWSGPAVLYVGSKKPPACSGDYAQAAMHGGTAASADAAQCSSCSCNAPASCGTYLNVAVGAQTDCSDAACEATLNTSCSELSSSCLGSLTTAYLQTRLQPGVSGCTASMQSPVIADPSWDKNVLACAAGTLRRGGCGPGNVCAPPGPFSGPYCIVHDGDQACPAGPYTDRRLYYAAIDDTRDCTACSCATDCSYRWQVFDDSDTSCGTPKASLTSAGQCTAVTIASASSGKIRVGVSISGSGACTASGGAPTGAAQASAPFTACCVP